MLELGADAYVTRPPSLVELVARVRTLLRRKLGQQPPRGETPGDMREQRPDNGDRLDGLTPVEFRIASCLLHNRGRLLSYAELLGGAWGNKQVSLDTLHYHMRRLRQKLFNGSISMFRGVGYCFN